MSLYNFKRLVAKYGIKPVLWVTETGGYHDYENGGVWVDGTIKEVDIGGAVTPLTNEELLMGEGGTYNSEDRKLYCYLDIPKGERIKHDGRTYLIDDKRDYNDFDAGLYIYFMKRSD